MVGVQRDDSLVLSLTKPRGGRWRWQGSPIHACHAPKVKSDLSNGIAMISEKRRLLVPRRRSIGRAQRTSTKPRLPGLAARRIL